MKGFTLGLALKQRRKATGKSPIKRVGDEEKRQHVINNNYFNGY